jgi:predicted acylesterase/phospholipase RssA
MENIALALSGGGLRAAAFSLGCLSYLSKVKYAGQPLLNNVSYISSTSGGSITNLLYCLQLYQGKKFPEIFDTISNTIDGEKLVSKAIQVLRQNGEWKARSSKSRNLINAFSIAYDEAFGRATFGEFRDLSNAPHVREICVNATEFSNGLSFRFQTQNDPDTNGRIGNGYIFFKEDEKSQQAADRIKLGDVLAASSCFPSGFEPLIFPNDFTHQSLSADDLENSIT